MVGFSFAFLLMPKGSSAQERHARLEFRVWGLAVPFKDQQEVNAFGEP